MKRLPPKLQRGDKVAMEDKEFVEVVQNHPKNIHWFLGYDHESLDV